MLFLSNYIVYLTTLLPITAIFSTEIDKILLCGTRSFPRLGQPMERRHCGQCLSSANGSICVACVYFGCYLLTQLIARRFGCNHLHALPFLIGSPRFEFIEEDRTAASSKVLSLAFVTGPLPHFVTPGAFEVTVPHLLHGRDGVCDVVGYYDKKMMVVAQ